MRRVATAAFGLILIAAPATASAMGPTCTRPVEADESPAASASIKDPEPVHDLVEDGVSQKTRWNAKSVDARTQREVQERLRTDPEQRIRLPDRTPDREWTRP